MHRHGSIAAARSTFPLGHMVLCISHYSSFDHGHVKDIRGDHSHHWLTVGALFEQEVFWKAFNPIDELLRRKNRLYFLHPWILAQFLDGAGAASPVESVYELDPEGLRFVNVRPGVFYALRQHELCFIDHQRRFSVCVWKRCLRTWLQRHHYAAWLCDKLKDAGVFFHDVPQFPILEQRILLKLSDFAIRTNLRQTARSAGLMFQCFVDGSNVTPYLSIVLV